MAKTLLKNEIRALTPEVTKQCGIWCKNKQTYQRNKIEHVKIGKNSLFLGGWSTRFPYRTKNK